MHVVPKVLNRRHLTGLRDGQWLKRELEHIWSSFFADTPRVNRVEVNFSGSWKSRLGVISLSEDKQTSYIGLNSLLSLPEAPFYVATITLAHELVHYAHGFGSPLPRRHRHPHRGGIVEKELVVRGLAEELDLYQNWIQNHWYDFYARCALNPTVVAPVRVSGDARETYESQ